MTQDQLDKIMMLTTYVETLAEKLGEEKKHVALVCLRQIKNEADNLIKSLKEGK